MHKASPGRLLDLIMPRQEAHSRRGGGAWVRMVMNVFTHNLQHKIKMNRRKLVDNLANMISTYAKGFLGLF